MLCSCCVYSFFILYMLCLLCWWCSNFLGGCFLLGLLILGRDGFWLVGFLSDAVFVVWWFLVGFWFGWFLDAVRFGDGFNFWGRGFFGWVSVGFLAFGCCGLLFLYWGVGWFGGLVFCGVFWFLQGFASLYRFNFASFYIFLGVVNSSAVNVNSPNFYFFKGSWMHYSSELYFYYFFILCIVFLYFLLQLDRIFL